MKDDENLQFHLLCDALTKLQTAVDIIDLFTDHTEVPEPIQQQISSLQEFIEESWGKL